MATIPKDIQGGLNTLSEVHKVPVTSLVGRLKEIMESDENIKAMPNEEFKIRFAFTALAKEMTTTGKEFIITPICYPRVREQAIKGEKTYVGDTTCLIQEIIKGEDGEKFGPVHYASGTLWREAAKNMENLEPGKVYKASFMTKDNSWGITISSNNTGFVGVDHKMDDFEKFFKENIEPQAPYITLADIDLNESDFPTDIKLARVTIMEADVKSRDDGSEYGYYDISDDTIVGRKLHRIFLHPKDIKYMQGSVLILGGNIMKDKKEVYRWNHQFQIPTNVAEKKEFKVKPVTAKEEVSISLDDEGDEGKEESTESEMTVDTNESKKSPEKQAESTSGDEDVFKV